MDNKTEKKTRVNMFSTIALNDSFRDVSIMFNSLFNLPK